MKCKYHNLPPNIIIKISAAISLFIFTSFSFNACSTFLLDEKPAFIKVNGTQFELNGQPYYFEGANFWYAVYLGASGSIGDRPRLIRELDFLKSMGITNLRIIGASEQSYIGMTLSPGIIKKPDDYNNDLLDGLDFLLSEMKKRNMYAVIFLTNTWKWSGGMSQYNTWTGDSTSVDPSIDYNNFMNYSASFYRNTKAQQLYTHNIYNIITRKNKYDGLYYYEDPTIMSWQLANEPRPGNGAESLKWLDEYYRWINSTAQFIHVLDHNHLVSTGSEGLAGSLDSVQIYLNAHKSKYIDYLTFHLWPKDWGWYDANRADSTYPSSLEKAIAYIDEQISLARTLNKPVVMEEFGLPRDGGIKNKAASTTMRDKYFNKILSLVYDSASGGAPITGTNFWFWAGEGAPQNEHYQWGFGNEMRGVDNFNSIYSSDTTTINILKNYAQKLNALDEKLKK